MRSNLKPIKLYATQDAPSLLTNIFSEDVDKKVKVNLSTVSKTVHQTEIAWRG